MSASLDRRLSAGALFGTLGIDHTALPADADLGDAVDKAFRRYALVHHPDRPRNNTEANRAHFAAVSGAISDFRAGRLPASDPVLAAKLGQGVPVSDGPHPHTDIAALQRRYATDPARFATDLPDAELNGGLDAMGTVLWGSVSAILHDAHRQGAQPAAHAIATRMFDAYLQAVSTRRMAGDMVQNIMLTLGDITDNAGRAKGLRDDLAGKNARLERLIGILHGGPDAPILGTNNDRHARRPGGNMAGSLLKTVAQYAEQNTGRSKLADLFHHADRDPPIERERLAGLRQQLKEAVMQARQAA